MKKTINSCLSFFLFFFSNQLIAEDPYTVLEVMITDQGSYSDYDCEICPDYTIFRKTFVVTNTDGSEKQIDMYVWQNTSFDLQQGDQYSEPVKNSWTVIRNNERNEFRGIFDIKDANRIVEADLADWHADVRKIETKKGYVKNEYCDFVLTIKKQYQVTAANGSINQFFVTDSLTETDVNKKQLEEHIDKAKAKILEKSPFIEGGYYIQYTLNPYRQYVLTKVFTPDGASREVSNE